MPIMQLPRFVQRHVLDAGSLGGGNRQFVARFFADVLSDGQHKGPATYPAHGNRGLWFIYECIE